MIKLNPISFFILIITFSLITGCNDGSKGSRKSKKEPKQENIIRDDSLSGNNETLNIKKVTFFLENSGSMFGYVSSANDFKTSVVKLAYLPEFDYAVKNFYFVNGTDNPYANSSISVNYVGDDPEVLKNNLNQQSFRNYGDARYSDLTRMFEIALDSAITGGITILISDCIYDVGQESDPSTALGTETERTKKIFRSVLDSTDMQTILIKANSMFDGQYSYASKKGFTSINQNRPYYFIIFGESRILSKYFREDYIPQTIAGYEAHARFMKIDENRIPYQIVPSIDRIGQFRPDYKTMNRLVEAKQTRGEFQFAIAADLSSIPFPDLYKNSPENYYCSNPDYSVSKVERIIRKLPGVEGTHLITVYTNKNPWGKLEISLKNVIPGWVFDTNTEDEELIDENHTVGFKSLTNAISEAYAYKNYGKNLANLKIEISK